MYSTKNSRRQFLKLASGLMAAPLGSLSSFAQAQTTAQSPLRFLTIIDHFGVPIDTRNETWISSTANDYALTDDHLGTILQPLKAYRDNMLIVSGMNLDSSIETRSVATHPVFTAHTLGASASINKSTAAAKIPHASVDVTIGNYLNDNAENGRVHPHLYFTDYAARNDPTYCYDTSGILIRSYAGAKSAVDNLLGLNTADSLIQARVLAQQDILSKISTRVQTLKSEFSGATYQEKLEAYDASVNDLATQLELQKNQSCAVPTDFQTLSSGGRNIPESERGDVLKVIGQLFSCDMVSSATYAFGGELHNQHNHGFIDSRGDADVATLLKKNLHAASHRTDDASNKVHEYVRIHQSELIADLMETLSTTVDIDGNMLIDNTVIYIPSCMARNTHSKFDYATAIIAGKNTNLKGGYHYDCSDSTNNDLLVTLAQGVNVPITDHGGYNANGNRVNSLNNGPISKLLKTPLS